MNARRRTTAAAAALVTAIGLTAGGVALADANHKVPSYAADGSSSAGVTTPVLSLSSTDSHSTTNDSGATSSSNASPLAIGGTSVPGTGSTCSATGVPTSGEVSDSSAPAGIVVPAGPLTIGLLTSSCSARAVQSNNASSAADAALLTVDAPDAGVGLAVLPSHADSTTTSGSARSDSSFAVASATTPAGAFDVLRCDSSASANNGTSTNATTFTPITGAPATDAPCPVTTAGATYQRN